MIEAAKGERTEDQGDRPSGISTTRLKDAPARRSAPRAGESDGSLRIVERHGRSWHWHLAGWQVAGLSSGQIPRAALDTRPRIGTVADRFRPTVPPPAMRRSNRSGDALLRARRGHPSRHCLLNRRVKTQPRVDSAVLSTWARASDSWPAKNSDPRPAAKRSMMASILPPSGARSAAASVEDRGDRALTVNDVRPVHDRILPP